MITDNEHQDTYTIYSQTSIIHMYCTMESTYPVLIVLQRPTCPLSARGILCQTQAAPASEGLGSPGPAKGHLPQTCHHGGIPVSIWQLLCSMILLAMYNPLILPVGSRLPGCSFTEEGEYLIIPLFWQKSQAVGPCHDSQESPGGLTRAASWVPRLALTPLPLGIVFFLQKSCFVDK